MSDDRLILAIPSKGRLQDAAFEMFAGVGLTVERAKGGRGYRGEVKALPELDVLLLSGAEIARGLEAGEVHLGITGEDLLREYAPAFDAAIELLKPLGFGHADVVVAVPQGWIDVMDVEDLREVSVDFFSRHRRRMRVATKYANLTHQFFSAHGLTDYRIVESMGATEGAPANGAAELIVDITSSGATLAANDLKTIRGGTILESQAQLAKSLKARWSKAASASLAQIQRALGC
ncbi:ATP phosphoribosyltransferase [bacterium AH-315-P15]|nr:ATP phosphoribosyltransferase [bacterium AH-315-P15]